MAAVSDIRIDVNFFDHPKTRRLISRLGNEGAFFLTRLWAFTAKFRPDGNLAGFCAEEIEAAVDWRGDPGKLISTLIELRWIDVDGDNLYVHDWAENQPWACHAGERSEKARRAASVRNSKRGESYELATSKPVASSEQAKGENGQARRCAPSPSPSPVPKESATHSRQPAVDACAPPDKFQLEIESDGNGKIPPCPYEKIITLYHTHCPKLARVNKPTKNRMGKILTRWKENSDLKFWQQVFEIAGKSDFMHGGGDRGWRATFDWIIENDTRPHKIIETNGYESGKRSPPSGDLSKTTAEQARKDFDGW